MKPELLRLADLNGVDVLPDEPLSLLGEVPGPQRGVAFGLGVDAGAVGGGQGVVQLERVPETAGQHQQQGQ